MVEHPMSLHWVKSLIFALNTSGYARTAGGIIPVLPVSLQGTRIFWLAFPVCYRMRREGALSVRGGIGAGRPVEIAFVRRR